MKYIDNVFECRVNKKDIATAVSVVIMTAVMFSMTPEIGNSQAFTFNFKNPGFGGNPNYYSYFMGTAEAQKPDFSESSTSPGQRGPLDDFHRTMQRQMLSELSRQLVSGESAQFDFTTEGVYDLGDFTIQVMPGLDVINIEITDQLSGERTQVEIPRF